MVYSYSDKYILLSDSFHSIFKDFVNIKKCSKLITINNPRTITNNDYFYNFKQKEKSILYVGRLENNQKKVIRIVELWKSLETKYPDWKLYIVGDGPEKKSLLQYTQKHDLRNIFFEGFKSPIEYYKKASILLMTSEFEGLPLTLIEAISFGVIPIVYASFTSVSDVIDNYKNGITLSNNNGYNSKLMLTEIIKIMNDNEQMSRISHNAYMSSQRFDINNIYIKWNELFNSFSL